MLLQAQKSFERADADLKNIHNILTSIGITDIDADCVNDGLIDKVQTNINSLHKQSEDLTSRNLSIMVEIDKITSSMNLMEVCIHYYIVLTFFVCHSDHKMIEMFTV